MKKLISLLLTLLMIFSATVSAFAASSFKDVTSAYSWAESSIESLVSKGIVSGYPDGTYLPGKSISKQEALVLFARTLGCEEAANEDIADISYSEYEDSFAKYTSYAVEEAAYLVYKSVLTTDELSNYISASNMDKSLKRYEAATLIAKCLGGDVWLKNNPDVATAYADSDKIPANAEGYVYYASELGIIKGVDEKNFDPMGEVTRAQMAVMITRILDLMQYTYKKGIVGAIDLNYNTVTIRSESGENSIYNINKSIAVMIDGEKSALTLLSIGMEVVLTFSDSNLYSIDAVTQVGEEEYEGVFRSSATENGTTKVKLTKVGQAISEAVTYPLASNVAVTYKDSNATLASFATGDHVFAQIKNGKITIIKGYPKTVNVSSAVIEEIILEDNVQLKVRTTDNEVSTYPVESSVGVKKNGNSCTMTDLAIGDKVSISLDYGEVTSINATGQMKVVEGTISEINISKTPKIVVKVKEIEYTYTLSNDVTFTVDGKAATIYDLRLGYDVKINTTSATATTIEVLSVAETQTVTGTIVGLNVSYSMIKVRATKADGNFEDDWVVVNSSAKILDANDNKVKTLKDLSVGQTITCAGATKIGMFEATSIMILSGNQ